MVGTAGAEGACGEVAGRNHQIGSGILDAQAQPGSGRIR